MDIAHISVSRKKCFYLCQAQYKYRYHLKLPVPGPEPFYFVYGTIIHKIAETYVRKRGEQNIGDIAQDVIRGKIEIEPGKVCPQIPDDYKKKMQKHLRSIQNLTERIGTGGIVEHEFRYDLDPPKGKFVTGFIDRLIMGNDKAFIIDYKTTKKGKFRVNKETVLEDIQLRMYARVVQRNFGIKAENIKCALFYLEGEEIIACKYSEASLEAVEKELLSDFYRIEQADPDKVWGNVGWHCSQCQYNTLCPFYKPYQSSLSSKWDGDMSSIE